MSRRAFKVWYLLHRWTSLVCTAFILLLCLTGLPLIFHHEIDHLVEDDAEPAVLPADAPRANLDALIATARQRRPNDAVQIVFRPPDEPHVWLVVMAETPDASEATAGFKFDARTGDVLREAPDLGEGFLHLLLRLHVSLLVGLPGTLFLGLMGLLFAAALVSGAVVYGPFMRKLSFGTVRRERTVRLRWLDLHNLLGIVTLVWALVVGVTGVINTLARPMLGYWQLTELAAMTRAYRDAPPPTSLGSVQAAADLARTVEPDLELAFVAFPGTSFAGQHHYAAFMRGVTPLTARLLKPVLVDAQTGELTASQELPWYVTALLISQPLHFGDYGGLPLKILWALLDILTIIVLSSGLYLWFKRRKVSVEELMPVLAAEEAAGAGVHAAVGRGDST